VTLTFVVQAQEDGGRLDQLVARHCDISRRIARTLIATGCVHVNKRIVRILTRPVRVGAQVQVAQPQNQAPAPALGGPKNTHGRPDVEILYLDRWLLVVNKPARLLSEADRFGSPSLESVVPAMLKARRERSDVWLVHRLDAGTSGVLVMARSSQVARLLGESFREAVVRKRYLALCQGVLDCAQVVDAPLARQRGTKHGVDANGKPARTAVEPLVKGAQATLVLARPTTGRTHQIRVHMMHLGHPLLGDRLYGGPGFTSGQPPQAIGRAMLHAQRLVLPHPKKGETLTFEAPSPLDFLNTAEAFGIEMPKD
jgi:23S rRNA pseudouridine1911/1915/1917 synthase